jgi:hypothetical protein
MNRKFATFIPLSLMAIAALFLPWTGCLTIAGAAASSARYPAIGLNMAWLGVTSIILLAANTWEALQIVTRFS